MPVRFQVDSDFYDHPKTLDMSDAATALWVRAGSYSAAKLTDGFVADAMLVRLSRSPDEASQELVRRGLWRRVRGGYRFHDWEERGNLTRERVEAERRADRQRKRAKRQAIERATKDHREGNEGPSSEARGNDKSIGQQPTQNSNTQVARGIVRPESEPDSKRTPEGIRGLSVSVSESVSSPPIAPPLDDSEVPRNGVRRKRRATKLGNDWTPTDEHAKRAADSGLDLQREVAKFRAHAEANDRRQANWNSAFTQWLLHAEEYRRPNAPRQAGPGGGWWDN